MNFQPQSLLKAGEKQERRSDSLMLENSKKNIGLSTHILTLAIVHQNN